MALAAEYHTHGYQVDLDSNVDFHRHDETGSSEELEDLISSAVSIFSSIDPTNPSLSDSIREDGILSNQYTTDMNFMTRTSDNEEEGAATEDLAHYTAVTGISKVPATNVFMPCVAHLSTVKPVDDQWINQGTAQSVNDSMDISTLIDATDVRVTEGEWIWGVLEYQVKQFLDNTSKDDASDFLRNEVDCNSMNTNCGDNVTSSSTLSPKCDAISPAVSIKTQPSQASCQPPPRTGPAPHRRIKRPQAARAGTAPPPSVRTDAEQSAIRTAQAAQPGWRGRALGLRASWVAMGASNPAFADQNRGAAANAQEAGAQLECLALTLMLAEAAGQLRVLHRRAPAAGTAAPAGGLAGSGRIKASAVLDWTRFSAVGGGGLQRAVEKMFAPGGRGAMLAMLRTTGVVPDRPAGAVSFDWKGAWAGRVDFVLASS